MKLHFFSNYRALSSTRLIISQINYFAFFPFSKDYKNRFGDKDQYSFIEELFGTGLTNEEISKESKRHISSSTEDLKILLNDEKTLLKVMKQDKDQSMFLSYIEEIGLLESIER